MLYSVSRSESRGWSPCPGPGWVGGPTTHIIIYLRPNNPSSSSFILRSQITIRRGGVRSAHSFILPHRSSAAATRERVSPSLLAVRGFQRRHNAETPRVANHYSAGWLVGWFTQWYVGGRLPSSKGPLSLSLRWCLP